MGRGYVCTTIKRKVHKSHRRCIKRKKGVRRGKLLYVKGGKNYYKRARVLYVKGGKKRWSGRKHRSARRAARANR